MRCDGGLCVDRQTDRHTDRETGGSGREFGVRLGGLDGDATLTGQPGTAPEEWGAGYPAPSPSWGTVAFRLGNMRRVTLRPRRPPLLHAVI